MKPHPYWDARVNYGGEETAVRQVYRDAIVAHGRRDGLILANRWMSGYDLTHRYRTCLDCSIAYSVGGDEIRCSACLDAYEPPTGDRLVLA